MVVDLQRAKVYEYYYWMLSTCSQQNQSTSGCPRIGHVHHDTTGVLAAPVKQAVATSPSYLLEASRYSLSLEIIIIFTV